MAKPIIGYNIGYKSQITRQHFQYIWGNTMYKVLIADDEKIIRMGLRSIIDWEDYRNALQEIGFQGSFSLECSVPEEFTGKERDAKEQELCRLAAQLAGNE